MKRPILLIAGILLLGCALEVAIVMARRAGLTPTYTVTVDGGLWKHTNVVEIILDHEKSSPPCALIRYVDNGITNEFHAWAVPINVETNAGVVEKRGGE